MSPSKPASSSRYNFESSSKKIGDILIPTIPPPHNFATPSNYQSQSRRNSPIKNFNASIIESQAQYEVLIQDYKHLEAKYNGLLIATQNKLK